MKILIIGATHGNELLGPKLYQCLLQKRSPLLEYIDFIIGNPRAYAAKKRYVDTDLNRSYQSHADGYETKRADEIRKYIEATQPDLVLDMHTTTCVQPNCLIVSGTDGVVRQRFLRACHIPILLKVKPMGDILSIPTPVVAYEVPNDDITVDLLNNIAKDIDNFVNDRRLHATKQLYTMTGKIYKKDVTDDQVAGFINFTPHNLGFVPIMTGENSYKKQTDYLGFKATQPHQIVIS